MKETYRWVHSGKMRITLYTGRTKYYKLLRRLVVSSSIPPVWQGWEILTLMDAILKSAESARCERCDHCGCACVLEINWRGLIPIIYQSIKVTSPFDTEGLCINPCRCCIILSLSQKNTHCAVSILKEIQGPTRRGTMSTPWTALSDLCSCTNPGRRFKATRIDINRLVAHVEPYKEEQFHSTQVNGPYLATPILCPINLSAKRDETILNRGKKKTVYIVENIAHVLST